MSEYEHIAELRAELSNCFLTKRERRQAEAELRRAEKRAGRAAA